MMHPFDFFQVTKKLDYSRVLVRDPSQRLCLGGIDDTFDSFQKVIEELRALIVESNANYVMVVGTSGGSYAAILAGHLLKANFVHAFSPATYVNISSIVGHLDFDALRNNWRTIMKLYSQSFEEHRYFDLKKVLSTWNGVTKYYVHVSKYHKLDYMRASHIKNCQGVTLLEYPCKSHNIVRFLYKNKLLIELLKEENQSNLFTWYQNHFEL